MTSFNVLFWDFNADRLTTYDVLPYFRKEYEECRKKDRPITREQWKEFIESKGRYRFWSRCQYEIIVSPWPTMDKDVKIDAYKQIENNLDLIIDILMKEYGS